MITPDTIIEQMTTISDRITVLNKDNLKCWCLLICNASCNTVRSIRKTRSFSNLVHQFASSLFTELLTHLWRIQDLPEVGRQPIIWPKFAENEENWAERGASKILLCRSATAHGHVEWTAITDTSPNSQSAAELFTCYNLDQEHIYKSCTQDRIR